MSKPSQSAAKTKMGESLRSFKGVLLDLMGALRSPDRPTRQMAFFLVLCLVFALGTVIRAVFHYRELMGAGALFKEDTSQAENLSKMIEKQKQAAQAKYTSYRLGTFAVAMTDIPGSKPLPGVVNMAEIEIILECDVKDTCDWIEQDQVRIRDGVTSVLSPLDRKEILSTLGKARLKDSIREKINLMIPKGKEIKNVYFSRLLID